MVEVKRAVWDAVSLDDDVFQKRKKRRTDSAGGSSGDFGADPEKGVQQVDLFKLFRKDQG